MVLRYSSGHFVSEKCVQTIDRGVSAVFEQSAVPGQSECHAIVSSPLGDLAHVTTRGDHYRDKAVPKSVEGDVVQFGAQHRRPQDVASPRAEERATGRCGERERICARVNKLREMLLESPHD